MYRLSFIHFFKPSFAVFSIFVLHTLQVATAQGTQLGDKNALYTSHAKRSSPSPLPGALPTPTKTVPPLMIVAIVIAVLVFVSLTVFLILPSYLSYRRKSKRQSSTSGKKRRQLTLAPASFFDAPQPDKAPPQSKKSSRKWWQTQKEQEDEWEREIEKALDSADTEEKTPWTVHSTPATQNEFDSQKMARLPTLSSKNAQAAVHAIGRSKLAPMTAGAVGYGAFLKGTRKENKVDRSRPLIPKITATPASPLRAVYNVAVQRPSEVYDPRTRILR